MNEYSNPENQPHRYDFDHDELMGRDYEPALTSRTLANIARNDSLAYDVSDVSIQYPSFMLQ